MTTLKEKRNIFTLMIEFKVKPQHQLGLINGIAGQLEKINIKDYPGFVSAVFHASQDGEQVINYAQWRTKEDWEKFNEEQKSNMLAVIDQYHVKPPKITEYYIVKSFDQSDRKKGSN